MKLQKAVGLRISDLMLKNKLSRYALCKKCLVLEQTVKHIIDERNQDIKLSTIKNICEGLDMKLKDFFDSPFFDNLD